MPSTQSNITASPKIRRAARPLLSQNTLPRHWSVPEPPFPHPPQPTERSRGPGSSCLLTAVYPTHKHFHSPLDLSLLTAPDRLWCFNPFLRLHLLPSKSQFHLRITPPSCPIGAFCYPQQNGQGRRCRCLWWHWTGASRQYSKSLLLLLTAIQPLSLLLKNDPNVDELSLYDVVNTPGVAADLSHISTPAVRLSSNAIRERH